MNKIRTALAAPGRALPGSPLARLRVAVTVFFALDGFLFAGWVVRIPAIKERTGASPGALGLALLGVSAGAVATMLLTGRLCDRFGSRQVTVATGALLSCGVVLPALARSALVLGLVLLAFGAAYGGLNVAMNSVAVELVAALRRPVMPSFHAAFSLGGLAGAGLGGMVAPYLSPTRHLLLLVPAGLLAAAVGGGLLMAHPVSRPDGSAPARGRPAGARGAAPGQAEPGARPARKAGTAVFVLGLIAMCDAYGEGALADWGPLHIREDLGGGPGVSAAGYAVFALAMAVGRLSGTALLERLGQSRVLVLGGLSASAGMLVGALAPHVWLVLAGFAVTGLGLANIFPVAVARAGALGGPRGVAVASTLGYGGMLLGPPSIGFLADAFGLPTGLTTVALLAAAAAVIAYVVRDLGRHKSG